MRTVTDPPRLRWPRFVGGALLATGVLGILISMAGMVFVGLAGARAERALSRELVTLDTALLATADGLTVAGDALVSVEGTLGSLGATLSDATASISDTQPTLATIQNLTGTSLPATIRETQVALDSAQIAANAAEDVLGSLRFLGVRYSPEVPLGTAIGRVGTSLADVPDDLIEVATGLDVASANLTQLTANLAEVAEGIDAIRASVDDSTAVVAQYQTIVEDLRAEVTLVQRDAPGWIATVRWGLYVALIWLALAQIGLLAQGWELLGRAESEAFDRRDTEDAELVI